MEEPLVRPATVAEFQLMFERIYKEANASSSPQRFISILGQTAILGVQKNARKNRDPLILEQLPNVVSRAFALASHFEINVEDALHFKFPGVCSYCLESDGCRCLIKKTEEKGATPEGEAKLLELRGKKENLPKSMRDHQMLHGRLYARQHEMLDVLYLSTRLVEETAEIAEAHDIGRRDDLRLELADVFSWIFAICNRMNMNRAEHKHIYIDELVWRHYPYQCKKCHRNICCGKCGSKVGA